MVSIPLLAPAATMFIVHSFRAAVLIEDVLARSLHPDYYSSPLNHILPQNHTGAGRETAVDAAQLPLT